MSSIRAEIENSFRNGDSLTRLIIINLGVFLLYYIILAIAGLMAVPVGDSIAKWIALPSNLGVLITRPWTIITYMFFHEGFYHIFFNLLVFYFSGRLFLEYMGSRRLLSYYLLGGIIGGLLYVIFYNVFPAFSEANIVATNRGASAGIMAVLVGIATYRPRFPVKLFFVWKLDLWIIAAMLVFVDIITIGADIQDNPGGRIAHLGGALFGYLSIQQLKKGNDWTEGFSKFLDNLANWFRPKPKVRKVYSNAGRDNEYHEHKIHNQEKMDAILDKISRSGYDSLSKEEKDYLFKIGQEK